MARIGSAVMGNERSRWMDKVAVYAGTSNVYPQIEISKVKDKFLNHKNTCSHSRHLSKEDCRSVGLNVIDLEESPRLNDAVMSLHDCYMIMIDKFPYSKIIENQKGEIFICRTA